MTHVPLNQWESATAGAHHQAGELEVAFPAGGSSSGHGTQSAGMAPQVCALNDAAWPQDREGRDGAATSDSAVLDDAPGMGLSGLSKCGSHAGQPGNRYGVQSNIE